MRSVHRRRGMTRKAVLLVLGTVSIVTMVLAVRLSPSEADVPPGERPNIVFVLSDNQNWKFMGCAGHPFLETPNMDRLAREGVLFTNAFVTTSLCSPSRASFLTGKYAHTHGVQNNFTPWDGSHPTFLEVLEAGRLRHGLHREVAHAGQTAGIEGSGSLHHLHHPGGTGQIPELSAHRQRGGEALPQALHHRGADRLRHRIHRERSGCPVLPVSLPQGRPSQMDASRPPG